MIPHLLSLVLLIPLSGQTPDVIPPSVSLPRVSIDYDQFNGSLDHADARQVHIVYGDELSLKAGRVQGDLLHGQYEATGGVGVHEADTDLKAHTLTVQGSHATAAQAVLTQRPYTLRAGELAIGPGQIIAHAAEATTAPPNTRPDFEVRAQTISLFPERRHGEMQNASLYLFRTRLLTLPHLGFTIGASAGGANRKGFLPTAGVSGQDGTYLALGGNMRLAHAVPVRYRVIFSTKQQTQVRVSSTQTLYQQAAPDAPIPPGGAPLQPDFLGAIRRLATITGPPLPENDPLLFHDFLPDRTTIALFDEPPRLKLTLAEEFATHQETLGRRLYNIYVSRLPEVSINGVLPLSGIRQLDKPITPETFRREMRRIKFVAYGQIAEGAYREERPGQSLVTVHATRQQDTLGLRTLPLLVVANTVIEPQVELTTNFYSGQRKAYRYVRFSVAANHYFTPFSAVGLLYQQSGQSGDSPFDFDVLDTTRELDGRIQVGNRRLAVAVFVRYDLARGGVLDYKIAIAPGLQGITPVFSYSFRTRSIGVGVEVKGLTY